ncbi:MAG: c-type cytochrome [Pseudomonadales bacterium]
MFTVRVLIATIGVLLTPCVPAQDLQPKLGQPILDLPQATIAPDGKSLPPGSGSVEEGLAVYQRHCLACHGPKGDMPGNALVGGQGSLTSALPVKTVGSYWPYATTLFDYISRAMPYGNEKILSVDQVYAVSAYVLFLNGILPAETRLTASTLPEVVMPNRHGFQRVYQAEAMN